MLLPTSIVAINREGLSRNGDKIRALMSPRFFINSKCNLFEATKAISIPEKNAEQSRDVIIMSILSGSIKVV